MSVMTRIAQSTRIFELISLARRSGKTEQQRISRRNRIQFTARLTFSAASGLNGVFKGKTVFDLIDIRNSISP